MGQLQAQSQHTVLLVRQLHGSTLQLLITMYNPQEFQEVMEDVVLFILQHSEDKRYPFMVLQFGDNPLGEIPIDDPPESYIWN